MKSNNLKYNFLLEKNQESLEDSLLTNATSVFNKNDETKLSVSDRQVESIDVSIEEIPSASTVERNKQSRKKKRPNNKRRQNRINQLRQKSNLEKILFGGPIFIG